MNTRKEEERNEKIIRGLMKLPPNRRCINCNSLGPQYVCTNFWTFVCMTCSGIHREFTHRVKSVSMSKFTSQEVEALQRGGNQRARETFLKFWDQQEQRLPVSSNADKVREFIKNVYVDRRYADGKTSDKPPRDVQKHRNHVDETRRASSYHSYSQSPPYDFQYEEQRYGKQIAMRKPGSDRGLYEGKVSNLLSPSQSSDQMSEDGFANEVSNPRVSDYSMSSGGDPIRFDIQSLNFQRDVGFGSPSSDTSRDFFVEDVCHHHPSNAVSGATARRTIDQIHCPQRGASLGSSRSFESNAFSSQSVSSVSLVDVASDPEQHARTQQDKLSSAHFLPQSSVVRQFGGLDLFDAPIALQNIASTASASEMPRPAETSSTPVDLFQPSPISSVPSFDSCQAAQNSAPPKFGSNLEKPQQQSPATLTEKTAEPIIPRNEGWATFDVPQHVEPIVGLENSNPAILSTDRGFPGNFNAFPSLNTTLKWPAFPDSSALTSSSWHDGLHNIDASVAAKSSLSWDAFENSTPLSLQSLQSSQPVVVQNSSSVPDPYPGFEVSEQAGGHAPATKQKSTNPFDLPDNSVLEPSNMFLDMSSLQAVLPNGQMPTSFAGGATQPWFIQNSVSYMPAGSQGPLGFMAVQGPSTHIVHVPTQGPVASIGGNPFA